ncbi:MAG: sensor histidine kinase [Planctomycetota bacterium]|jgi:signal transduction histidine kinase
MAEQKDTSACSDLAGAGPHLANHDTERLVMGAFAAGAAHELNDHLAIMSGRAQLMREKAGSDEERKTWGIIVGQAQQISDVISELMDLAVIPKVRGEVVDLHELVKNGVSEFSESLPAKATPPSVDIEEGGAAVAWADPAHVTAVVAELLSNAYRAADGAVHITISARACPDEGAVILTVADDGPGMDAQSHACAFTPFFSSQRAGRRRGLGLPRARMRIEANGGEIWLESGIGGGTTVFIRLPGADCC